MGTRNGYALSLVSDIKFTNIPFSSRVGCKVFNFNACFDRVSYSISTRVYFSSRAEYVLFESMLSPSAPKINFLISLSYSAKDCFLDLLSARLIRVKLSCRI